MTKPNSQRKVPIQYLVIGCVVIAAVGVMMYFVRPKKTVAPTTNTTTTSATIITTDDGINLEATGRYPVRNVQVPAVVFLHEYGQDRHQWDAYLQTFLDAGVAVLSYDMRGFGASRLAAIPPDQQTHLATLPNDLHAVISYLEQQPSIDPAKISIIGAGVGADVAYVASGSNLDVHRVVLLSPAQTGTALDGHDVEGFASTGVFGIANDSQQAVLNKLIATVTDPKDQRIVPGSVTGVKLFDHQDILSASIAWIQQ